MRNHLAVGAVVLAMAAACSGAAQARAAFDDRAPADVLSVIVDAGGKGKIEQEKPSSPQYLSASDKDVNYFVDFNHCAQSDACKILMFNASWETTDITADQMNEWNQGTALCPAYLDKEHKPVMWMPVASYGHKPRGDLLLDVKEFLGCLHDFDDFANDPAGFLKKG